LSSADNDDEAIKITTSVIPVFKPQRSLEELILLVIFGFKNKEDQAAIKIQRCVRRKLLRPVEGSVGNGVTVVERRRSFSEVVAFDVEEDEEKRATAASEIEHREIVADANDILDYNLPAGPLSAKIVSQIIEVYRQGGRLCLDAVHKLLRLSYRRMRSAPNITRVEVKQGGAVTVVGDLHGAMIAFQLCLSYHTLLFAVVQVSWRICYTSWTVRACQGLQTSIYSMGISWTEARRVWRSCAYY